ncbi:MAG: hypothetical protein AAF236_00330 [Verrucomicrobiota bacterium]
MVIAKNCSLVFVTCFAFAPLATPQEAPALRALSAKAKAQPQWGESDHFEKLKLIREVALEESVVSTPVSNRYEITALGGPIDWVHFLALALEVAKGKKSRDDALLYQWLEEGGEDFLEGRSDRFPPEAHPDDLPSNAFGALFGEEQAAAMREAGFDVVSALDDFIRPLEPVDHEESRGLSHRVVVMGLSKNASHEVVLRRSEWFTAVPIFTLHAYDKARASQLGNAERALSQAGFKIRKIEGLPIAIDRVSEKPER